MHAARSNRGEGRKLGTDAAESGEKAGREGKFNDKIFTLITTIRRVNMYRVNFDQFCLDEGWRKIRATSLEEKKRSLRLEDLKFFKFLLFQRED